MARVMKDSEVLWIGDIPSVWRMVPLKNLAAFKNGDWGNDPKESEQIGRVLTCYRKADFSELGTVEEGQTLRRIDRKPFVSQLDILVEKSGGGDLVPVGAIAIVNAAEPAACSNFLTRVRTIRSVVDPRYLWRVLSTLHSSAHIWSLFKQTTGIQNLDMRDFAAVALPCPSIGEQRRIAAWLDIQASRIDKRLELLGKKRAVLGNLRISIISEAVCLGIDRQAAMRDTGNADIGVVPKHWQVIRLKDISLKIGSGKTPLGGGSVYSETGITFLRSQNVWDDGLRLDDVVFISEEIDWDMKASRVKSKDILLNITGASIGRTALVPKVFPRANVSQHVCIVRLRDTGLANYVVLALLARSTQRQIAVEQVGAARDGLNFEQIGRLVIPFSTSEEERQRIVALVTTKVAQIDQQIRLLDQLEGLLKQQRKAIIHDAVTGKIDLSAYVPPQP